MHTTEILQDKQEPQEKHAEKVAKLNEIKHNTRNAA